MFSLLLLLTTPLALAWHPAPGIPLERQLPVKSRQGWSSGYGEDECDFEPYYQACNETEIWCDGGYYNGNSCWFGNYCLQQVSDFDGCPGVCHTPCNWETEDFCDMGYKTFGHMECWVGNWCQDKSLGGCPAVGYYDYDYYGYGGYEGYGEYSGYGGYEGYGGYGEGYGSGSHCYEAHYQECSPYEINCDAGYDSMGCWYGNYCIQEVNEYDGCYGVCGQNCNYETEDWCDMGFDSNGCWMGNWCQDKSEGGCPAPHYGSEMASGEDVCAHVDTWHETCNGNQTSCDLGYSPEQCWYGNYCIESVDHYGCPGVCATQCDWATEEWCDLGFDGQEGYGWSGDGCWLGNWCNAIGATAPSSAPSGDYGYGMPPSSSPSGAPSGDYSYGMPPSSAPSGDYGMAPGAAPSPAGLERSGSSCYGLSERATAMERAGINKK